MSEDQSALLSKAHESYHATQVLLDAGHAEFAAARAYYTMFYVAQAILLEVNLSFSKHSAVIVAFGREFIKTGKIPPEFHRYLIEAQEARLTADYDTMTLSQGVAVQALERAEQFLALARQHFGSQSDVP